MSWICSFLRRVSWNDLKNWFRVVGCSARTMWWNRSGSHTGFCGDEITLALGELSFRTELSTNAQNTVFSHSRRFHPGGPIMARSRSVTPVTIPQYSRPNSLVLISLHAKFTVTSPPSIMSVCITARAFFRLLISARPFSLGSVDVFTRSLNVPD
jgi:hypothetical protein